MSVYVISTHQNLPDGPFFYYSTRDGDGVGAAGGERESGGDLYTMVIIYILLISFWKS